MPVTIKVKTSDEGARTQRKSVAQRVLDYFESGLPPSRLLCFLDDADPQELRAQYGPDNRGLYGPIHGSLIRDSEILRYLPDYVTNCVFPDDGVSAPPFPRVYDDLIYLYGSTCADQIGLTMIMAHELQHAIQHATARKVWAVNHLVTNLDSGVLGALGLTWVCIPTELDARIVSKRVALYLYNEESVSGYIRERIAERTTEQDTADWRFVLDLPPTSSIDLDAETKRLLRRMGRHRAELEAILLGKKRAHDPDFLDVDLGDYL